MFGNACNSRNPPFNRNSNMMRFDLSNNQGSPIKVIGVGGGGSNAVNYMFQQGINGVDFIVCNTDNQALDASAVPTRIQLGTTLTAGQGAGSIPETGKNAAIENLDDVLSHVNDSTTMVFVTAGMGGGTGTGAAPVIAKACKDLGILTVGIVTVPFNFEGRRRANQATDGLEEMRASVDTLLVIRNDKLRELFGNLALKKAFSHADEVLCTAAKGIAEVITLTGDINVDMNDVKTVMRDSGAAIMGAGEANGEGRAMTAVAEALESPLLNDSDITGANFVLLNITYGTEEVLMDEISEITDYIQDQAGATAEVIWGYGHDESLGDKICVTVIATGFETNAELPEGPTAKLALGDDIREITHPLEGPMTQVAWSNKTLAPENDQLHLKSTEGAGVQQEPEGTEMLTNSWQAEDVTSEVPSAAPELFHDAQADAAEEVTLLHRETLEEAVKEYTASIVEEKEAVDLPADAATTQVGDYTVLDLETADDNNLLPEALEGVAFTNEQVDPSPHATATEETPAPVQSTPAEPVAKSRPNPTPQPRPAGRMESNTGSSELTQRNARRQASIEEYTKRLRTPSGLTDLENEPAYKRRNIQLAPTPASDESQATRLSIDEETGGLKTDNPYLHDNVD
jgi:cell division protein FtsZ